MTDSVPRWYGVKEQTPCNSPTDLAAESLQLWGYAVIDGGYSSDEVAAFREAFDKALMDTHARYGGLSALEKIDEHQTIRAPLSISPLFTTLAANALVLSISRRLIGDYIILNQQNGIINPPNAKRYNQDAFHRDLPYQHFVSSRPLALNALFCLDPFATQNGATFVIPASHKTERLPSAEALAAHRIQVTAPAGSFIILDAMTFHCGGVNHTSTPRRAVNHLYSIPLLRQQIDLPRFLGPNFTQDAMLRRLLGYDLGPSPDMNSYYASRPVK